MPLQRITPEQIKPLSDSYNTFKDQLIGMSIPYFETHIATEGQTLITLSNGKYYAVGTGQLKVYLNGQLVNNGGEYVEVNEQQIRFNFPLYKDDVVLLRIEGAGGGVSTSDHVHYNGVTPTGITNGLNKVFTLPHIPRDNTVRVYINGIRQANTKFTVHINQLILDEAPPQGAELIIDYIV